MFHEGLAKRPAAQRAFAAIEEFREPPVHHEHFAELAHHDVLRLQVAVNHAARVRKRHGIAHLAEHPEQPPDAVLLRRVRHAVADVLEDGLQRAALHELHRVKRAALVVRTEVVDRHDVRMRQLREHGGLAHEAPAFLLRGRRPELHHLERDGAGELRVVHLHHMAHAPAPDEFAHAVLRQVTLEFLRVVGGGCVRGFTRAGSRGDGTEHGRNGGIGRVTPELLRRDGHPLRGVGTGVVWHRLRANRVWPVWTLSPR